MAEVIDVSILKGAGLDQKDIELVMSDMELMLKHEVKKTGSKLNLNIKFVEGPYKDKLI